MEALTDSHIIQLETHLNGKYRPCPFNFAEGIRINAQCIAKRIIRQTNARPKHCANCGRAAGKIEAHHENYTRPLDVVFLCPSCHRRRHSIKAAGSLLSSDEKAYFQDTLSRKLFSRAPRRNIIHANSQSNEQIDENKV